ncbi:hypothetical protein FB451DRAFT_1247951 [Mycena latifolia]|nr:hypothetical protein FB451DRAFT_1247951 [Mycena latifolia]
MSSYQVHDSQAPSNGNEGGVDEAGYASETGPGDISRAPAALNAQQQAQLAALLSFKPSSRDVISGIAPHVFDDQHSLYRSRHRRRASSRERRRRMSSPTPHKSPLRLSAATSVDEYSAGAQAKEDNIVIDLYTTPAPAQPRTASISKPMIISLSSTNENTKPKRRTFSIDRVFKCVVSISIPMRF